MITYNQEAYISEAIDSILAQKTNFDIELVIGDDNSKDGTEKICRQYAEKYPDKIRYYRRDPNMGMMPNFIQCMTDCRGKYIAICEGDDYWTDENKLQSQVDFMEAHPDHSLCCHLHSVLTNGTIKHVHASLNADTVEVATNEYMVHPFFHTSSYFFRNQAQPSPYPQWYNEVLAGDHFLVLFLSMKGKIGCLNKRMSVFRNHGKSVSFSRTALDIKDNFVKHLRLFDQYSEGAWHETISRVIKKWDLLYKVYEPAGYFRKLEFLFSNLAFYCRNFKDLGGPRLAIKYIVPYSLIRKMKS